jgi:hypothetical protein
MIVPSSHGSNLELRCFPLSCPFQHLRQGKSIRQKHFCEGDWLCFAGIGPSALFARIDNCGAKVLFEAAAGRFF